jgi:hypothetical protein
VNFFESNRVASAWNLSGDAGYRLKEDCRRPEQEIAQVIRVCIFGLNGEIEDQLGL